MSLPATRPERPEEYESCETCDGLGSFVAYDGECHEHVTCEECEGSGVFYLGPIYDPEHYLEVA